MGCLVVLFGFGVFLFGGSAIVAIAEGSTDAIPGLIIFAIICLIPFILCLKKYRSPEHQKKRKDAQEKLAAFHAESKEQLRLKTTIVSTRLIGEGSAEYKKSVGSMVVRGAIGGMLAGSAGATLGMATAMNKNTNKNVRRFLVKYLDGHIEEKEAVIGSSQYKEYMKYLEWEK